MGLLKSPSDRYGTRARASNSKPAGRKILSQARAADASHIALGSSGNRSLGAQRRGPRSTNGRKGRTSATNSRPACGLSSLWTSARSERGLSHLSSKFMSATQSTTPPSARNPRATASSRKALPRSSLPNAWKPRRCSLRNMGALASVATTSSNRGANSAVMLPAPAPTSNNTPPGLRPPRSCRACAVLRTKSPPLPTRAFASVSESLPRNHCAARSLRSPPTPRAFIHVRRKLLQAPSLPNRTKRSASGGGRRSSRHSYCNSAAEKRWLQWAHITHLLVSQSTTLPKQG
mmetsp:Transcript_31573/g.93999  ORF Transcript_31573/g.93999 Transcript_31573/m.93999 type:complete len:290 (+) Transcript_31573:147-1016(+)